MISSLPSQVRKRELKAAEKLMERQRNEDDLREKQDALRRMQEGSWTQTGEQTPAGDPPSARDAGRKDSKKNKKKGKKED